MIVHQVLHYSEKPARVISEAARVLRPDGVLVVADFSPHNLESICVRTTPICVWASMMRRSRTGLRKQASSAGPINKEVRGRPADRHHLVGHAATQYSPFHRCPRRQESRQPNHVQCTRNLCPTELPFPAGAPRDLKVSFEFFPPKTEKMADTLCGHRFNGLSLYSLVSCPSPMALAGRPANGPMRPSSVFSKKQASRPQPT